MHAPLNPRARCDACTMRILTHKGFSVLLRQVYPLLVRLLTALDSGTQSKHSALLTVTTHQLARRPSSFWRAVLEPTLASTSSSRISECDDGSYLNSRGLGAHRSRINDRDLRLKAHQGNAANHETLNLNKEKFGVQAPTHTYKDWQGE